jgi:hypothetical protein
MSKDEIKKKNNYIKGLKKIKMGKNITWRDKNVQLKSLIELKNSFNKKIRIKLKK